VFSYGRSVIGESLPVKKTLEYDRLLYGGTHINEGEGHFLVLTVGPNTRHGTILVLLSEQGEEVSVSCLFTSVDMATPTRLALSLPGGDA